jgi:dipeptidyl aminopeptidase/acylaminoacyl peptidase
MKHAALPFALTAAASLGSAQDARELDPPALAPADVFELEVAGDPRISPDGERVVYERRIMDAVHDRVSRSLWIVQSDGNEHRPLVSGPGGASSPRWSPDGKRLAYLAAAGNGAQIFVRWMDTGQTAQVTRLEESAGAPVWSPDGRWIAFTLFVESEIEPFTDVPEAPEGATWAPLPKVITSMTYRRDGEGYVKPGHVQLFVVPAEGGTPRAVTSGPHDVNGDPVWTRDGRELIFSSNRRPESDLEPIDSELWVVPIDGGELRQLTTRHGPDHSPALSPDGTQIAWLGFDDRFQGFQTTLLYVMPLAGGAAPRALTTSLDRSVESPVWAPDGQGLFMLYDDRGNGRLGYVSLQGQVREVLDRVGGVTIDRPYEGGSFSLSSNGRAAYTHSTPYRPADIHLAVPGRADGAPLTQLNEDLLGARELGRVEELVCASSVDQRSVQGWIVHPPGFDAAKDYPLILEIHGGPFSNYGDRFAADMQLYAAAGYIVLYVNPRGSTSYGEEFANLIHHAYPGHDYDDLMSAVDATIAKGHVDPDRLYVTGGSGGGVLTAWIVGSTGRFKAAVVSKPVINWMSFALTADEYPYFTRYWFSSMPWDSPEQYFARSPLSLVGKVTTPTMVLTGEEDWRTPISESEQYYQALKLRGIDTALVRIPEASHGITARPSRLAVKAAYTLEWFDRHKD